MRIYPAIDLRKGRCVRLRRGDPNAETVFSDDPAQMASHWAALGAEWLHVVNLDGAFGGASDFHPKVKRLSPDALETGDSDLATDISVTASAHAEETERAQNLPINLQRLQQIRQAVDIRIQFTGGLRSMQRYRVGLLPWRRSHCVGYRGRTRSGTGARRDRALGRALHCRRA